MKHDFKQTWAINDFQPDNSESIHDFRPQAAGRRPDIVNRFTIIRLEIVNCPRLLVFEAAVLLKPRSEAAGFPAKTAFMYAVCVQLLGILRKPRT